MRRIKAPDPKRTTASNADETDPAPVNGNVDAPTTAEVVVGAEVVVVVVGTVVVVVVVVVAGAVVVVVVVIVSAGTVKETGGSSQAGEVPSSLNVHPREPSGSCGSDTVKMTLCLMV